MEHFPLQISLLSWLLHMTEITLFLVNTLKKTELNANPCRNCRTPVMLNDMKFSLYYLYPDMLQLKFHM